MLTLASLRPADVPFGLPVRLMFDEGPATIGAVEDFHEFRKDGMPMYLVLLPGAGSDVHSTLPGAILVPVCEHEERVDDVVAAPDGALVEVSGSIPCHFDAEHVVEWSHGGETGPIRQYLCAEHAQHAREALERNGTDYEAWPVS